MVVRKEKQEKQEKQEHVYEHYLDVRDPQAEQPKKIIPQLKPHQLAALKRAITMETQNQI